MLMPSGIEQICWVGNQRKLIGVGDGIRTRDVQSHSLALYQAELRPPRQALDHAKGVH